MATSDVTFRLDVDTRPFDRKLRRIQRQLAPSYNLRLAVAQCLGSGLIAGLVVHFWR